MTILVIQFPFYVPVTRGFKRHEIYEYSAAARARAVNMGE